MTNPTEFPINMPEANLNRGSCSMLVGRGDNPHFTMMFDTERELDEFIESLQAAGFITSMEKQETN